MGSYSMIGTITLVIMVIAFLITIFLLTVKSKNRVGNTILAAYFLVFAIHISVFFYHQYISFPPVVEMLRDKLLSLSSPLLFLYLLSQVYADFKLKPIHFIHLTPLVVSILIYTPRFFAVSEEQRLLFMETFTTNIEYRFSYVISVLFTITYLVLMFRELLRYKELLREHYSDTTSFNYKWLLQLTRVVTFIFLASQVKQMYKITGDDLEMLNLLRLLLVLMLMCFLCWIVLKSMYQPEIFKAIDSKHKLAKTIVTADVSNNTPAQAQLNAQIDRLKNYMTAEEPYLDATITIQKLARQLKIPARDLSVLINHHLGQHFFEFISSYRIKKAIQIIENPANKALTFQEILYEVGYNSKSPFNKAFKKHTGQTPTAYKASLYKSIT